MASISTLTDNFDDNSLDAAKWSTFGLVDETNSQIEITTETGGTDAWLYSITTYDLTGSQATIKIIDAGNQSLASYHFRALCLSNVDTIGWDITGGNIIVNINEGAALATATYVANTHRYLRIREASGTTYYDYSADGISWTNFYTVLNQITVTAVEVDFNVKTSAEATTTIAKLDDFNILPAGGGQMTCMAGYWG